MFPCIVWALDTPANMQAVPRWKILCTLPFLLWHFHLANRTSVNNSDFIHPLMDSLLHCLTVFQRVTKNIWYYATCFGQVIVVFRSIYRSLIQMQHGFIYTGIRSGYTLRDSPVFYTINTLIRFLYQQFYSIYAHTYQKPSILYQVLFFRSATGIQIQLPHPDCVKIMSQNFLAFFHEKSLQAA